MEAEISKETLERMVFLGWTKRKTSGYVITKAFEDLVKEAFEEFVV